MKFGVVVKIALALNEGDHQAILRGYAFACEREPYVLSYLRVTISYW